MSPKNNINSGSNVKIDWNNVIKKEVIGIDGLDLGEVHEAGDAYFTTQKGLINKKRYHIPKSRNSIATIGRRRYPNKRYVVSIVNFSYFSR